MAAQLVPPSTLYFISVVTSVSVPPFSLVAVNVALGVSAFGRVTSRAISLNALA